jgi:ADP-ribose pyrophosphatase
MNKRFHWQSRNTEYRDVLASSHGEELRWLVSRDTIHDSLTGRSVTRAIIRHPGICVVAPFPAPDTIILVRQYRYALDGELWELPAGTLTGVETDGRVVATETPDACAVRELEEETGYRAGQWEKVAEWYAMPGSNDQVTHLFFARELAKVTQALEEGEVIHEVRAFATHELEQMLGRGDIHDAKTLLGLFFALSRRSTGIRIASGGHHPT